MSVVMESWLPRHKFDVDEYYRMSEFGILKPNLRVELIEGHVLDKTDSMAPSDWVMTQRESKAMAAVPDSWIPFHRFNAEEYHRMPEVGVLPPNGRVELIEGEVIDMASMGSWHCGTVDWLNELFCVNLRGHANIRAQGVVKLSRFSEPEPDIALFRRRQDFYRGAHPGAADTLLIVEVSDATLRVDQRVKIPLFAHFGVPEVWIVDRTNERLHFYRTPRDGDYTNISFTEKPGVTSLSALPDVTVDLSDLFG
jgi:Uma2 family endonuclease